MSGWEPREVTRYEYEGDRLVGAVLEREPEFSRTDVESLIAHLEMGRVGRHGQPMAEATSEDANPSNRARKYAYEADVYTDFAQLELDKQQKAFKATYGDDADMSGLVWVVRRVELPAPTAE